MQIKKIYIGGWFQRTTLHLSEIYDFFKNAYSPLDLDKRKLKNYQKKLNLKNVEMKVGSLEHIDVECNDNINIKIFEDGLISISTRGKSLKKDFEKLKNYYEKNLSPGLNYIFSLGAPIPKELAGIENIYPYFLVLEKTTKKEIKKTLSDFKEDKYFEIINKNFQIYRGDKLYIINNISEKIKNIEHFIHEQIFIREFKGQMHRYLNLHRIIWEKIANVKERGEIKGTEVSKFKDKIESYSKTVNLIEGRINQMGTYIHTREAVIKNNKDIVRLMNVLEYKHETLANTLDYIKGIWEMTKNYVNSAIDLFSDITAKSTGKSVMDLTVVTSMGVGAALLGLFTENPPPSFH